MHVSFSVTSNLALNRLGRQLTNHQLIHAYSYNQHLETIVDPTRWLLCIQSSIVFNQAGESNANKKWFRVLRYMHVCDGTFVPLEPNKETKQASCICCDWLNWQRALLHTYRTTYERKRHTERHILRRDHINGTREWLWCLFGRKMVHTFLKTDRGIDSIYNSVHEQCARRPVDGIVGTWM